MKEQFKKRAGAIILAASVLTAMVMPTFCTDTEVTAAGTSDVTVNLTVDYSDVAWFKVQLPLEVNLSYDAVASSNYNHDHSTNGYAYYGGFAPIKAKGAIDPSKKISVSIASNDLTLVGQTDSTKEISVDTFMELVEFPGSSDPQILDSSVVAGSGPKTGYSKTKVNFYATGYSGATESNVAAIALDPSDYGSYNSKVKYEAITSNPSAQLYTATQTFTISYE